jgi:predicted N-acetyltransferase YhbS
MARRTIRAARAAFPEVRRESNRRRERGEMGSSGDLRIVPLEPRWHQEAVQLLARAYVTNPLNAAAFGPGRLARNEAFFRAGLAAMKGPKLVALDGARVVGFIRWVQSPGCQLPAGEKLKLLPAMLRGFGLRSALRVSTWLSTWARHDPEDTHLHLGPIAVDPPAQGRGLGRQLMARYCEAADAAGTTGYLETDRPENLPFYRGFGFETVGEVSILGVTNYFMRRGGNG